jgi:hypothetical protein
MSRKRLGIALGALVAAALVGWVAGLQVKSPAELAAATKPPDPSPILVPVEERILSTDVITRGTGRYGSGQQLRLAPSNLKSGARIVTSIADLGSTLREGDVAGTVSGRPAFLLGGTTPAYRDLGVGTSGRDVRQLEAALQRLGFGPGRVDGVFDGSTEAAVARLYTRARVSPFRTAAGRFGGGGVRVPADEIIFVPSLPVRVSEQLVPLGASVEGPIMAVTDSVVVIDSSVPVEEATLVAAGKTVLIDEPALGIQGTGTITRVAAGPGTDGVDGFHVYFQVLVDDALPIIVKASVRIRVPIESTAGSVLAVPVTAVTLGSDGTSRVQKQVGKKFELVTVVPGLSAGGFVEVKVVKGSLKPGDLVVVGFGPTRIAP